MRWQHPVHGLILPGHFIHVAEETGLIVPVGDFVLQRVLENMSALAPQGGATLVPVAVNVSAVQLQRYNLQISIVALTSAARHQARAAAARDDRERHVRASAKPAEPARAGCDLATARPRRAHRDRRFRHRLFEPDYLKHWHVDYLKIDRSFVRDLVTDSSDLAIVGAIIAIARHLNIKVVAEGIEG